MSENPTPENVPIFSFTHSGVTYLLNILLELDLCIFREPFDDFWTENANGDYLLDNYQRVDLGVWFPSFQNRHIFSFRNKKRFSWSHTLPRTPPQKNEKALLMVRNPLDVLFSSYKRLGQDISFLEYLQEPLHPGEFGYNPPMEWALFNRAVQLLYPDTQLHVIRFEDIKKSPLSEIKRILAFLEITIPDSEISKAVEASSFEKVKEASKKWYEKYPDLRVGKWEAMRKGQVGEGGVSFGESEHSVINGLPLRISQEFGYETEREPPSSISAPLLDNSHTILMNDRTEETQALLHHSHPDSRYRLGLMLSLLKLGKKYLPDDSHGDFVSLSDWIHDSPMTHIHSASSLAKFGFQKDAKRLLDHVHSEGPQVFGIQLSLAEGYKSIRSRSSYTSVKRKLKRLVRNSIQKEQLFNFKAKHHLSHYVLRKLKRRINYLSKKLKRIKK